MSIETMYDAGFFIDGDVGYPIFFEKAIKACEEALAEAEKQEPVAWIKNWADGSKEIVPDNYEGSYPVYTHPAQDETSSSQQACLVPLSDDEIASIDAKMLGEMLTTDEWIVRFARAIEQAHGIV